jgi:translation initiation factor 5B
MAYLRQPIISVLGHVDHGKTSLLDFIRNSKLISKEAGGITQHIGATEVPQKDVIEIVKSFIPKHNVKIPGLLFIDTPGHKAFTSLRKRGGSISDIGILIVDLNEGFKPQTIEAVEILKSMKTPFIVAANKMDKLPGWQSSSVKGEKLLETIAKQRQDVNYKLEEKVYEIVGKLNEFGYEADRFDRVDDFTKKIAVVPISAHTGEGITELLSTLVGLTQKFMEKKLTIENEDISRGVILEVKDYPGLGKTIDVILYDGVIRSGDTILALDIDCVQESRLKSILKPNELAEIRDSSTKFKTIKEIHAAAGIKLACPDLKDIKAGMPIISVRSNASEEEIEHYRDELLKQQAEITISSNEHGILVKADTLGSLEALSHILEEHNIPLRRAAIGKITKKDIIDAGADLKKNPKNALILNFSQKIDDDMLAMAKEYNVEIISNDIIYKLIEEAVEWIEQKEKEIERAKLAELTMPFKIKILNNCIFRASSPAVIGVEVTGGKAKPGIPLMTNYGKKVGSIKTIKDKDEYLKILELGQQAAVSIDDLVIGRHANEGDELVTFMGEDNFRKLKKNIDLLSKDEIAVLKEIAEIMRKEDTLWGI